MRNVLTTITFLYLLIIAVVTDIWWGRILYQEFGGAMDAIYQALSIDWVNGVTVLVAFVTTAIVACKTWKQSSLSWYADSLLAFLMAELLGGTSWIYADTIIPRVDYKQLLVSCILMILVTRICTRVKTHKKHKGNRESAEQGFSVDNDESNYVDVGWEGYSQTLAKRLAATNLLKESFAVGISGKWGTGKTSFLSALSKSLKDEKFTIVEFNPWKSNDVNLIQQDFIAELEKTVGKDNALLGKALEKYADAIESVTSVSGLTKLLHIAGIKKHKSLAELKDAVNDRAKQDGKKYAVLIDDLDRLDADEVLEVLKMVRVSANFTNIVFVVAYDANYVSKVLKEKGIEDGREYIKKIFQVEVTLPQYESYKVLNILYRELKLLINDRSTTDTLRAILGMGTRENYVVAKHLMHFRDVKRFANIFALNLERIQSNLHGQEFYVIDFFWLELLHYSSSNVYIILGNNPRKLLATKHENGLWKYSLKQKYARSGAFIVEQGEKKGQTSPLGTHITSEEDFFISDDVATILYLLFESLDDNNLSRIRYLDNYFKYFSYRLPDNKISSVEFEDFISSDELTHEVVDGKVKEWKSNYHISHDELINRIAYYMVDRRELHVQKNYLRFLFFVLEYDAADRLGDYILLKTDKKQYLTEHIPELQEFLLQLCKEGIITSKQPMRWLKVLVKMYPTQIVDENNMEVREEKDIILEQCHIKELLALWCEKYIDKNTPITDILNTFSRLSEAMQTATITTTFYTGGGDEKYCVIIDYVKELFARKKTENRFEEYAKFFDFDHCDIDQEEYVAEGYRKKIMKLFGSRAAYIQFIKSCFNITSEEMELHLSRVRLSEYTRPLFEEE